MPRAGSFAALALAISSCGTALTHKGRIVLVEKEAPAGCESIGDVVAEVGCTPTINRLTNKQDTSDCRDEGVNALRNQAGQAGANLIVVGGGAFDGASAWHGTATGYLCAHITDPGILPSSVEDVAVVRHGADVQACTRVGVVEARGAMTTDREAAMRQEALSQGANTVLVQEHGARRSTGSSYLCTGNAPRPVVTPAPRPKAPARKVLHRDRLAKPMAMLVLELGAIGDVDQRVSTLMTDILLSELGSVRHLKALGLADVETMLDVRRRQDLLACENTTCMAELGGALGAQLVLRGRIGNLGSKFVVNLTVIDTARASVVVRINETLDRDEDVLAPAAPRLVGDVVYQINRSL